MDRLRLLELISDKTIEQKYTIPDVNFDFFGYVEGKGMYVKDYYIEVAKKYERIDMMYDFFDWQNGVGFYALIEAGKKLKTNKYLQFVKEWVDYHITKGLPEASINTSAPFLSLMELYKETRDENYFKLCEERASYIMNKAPRTKEGILEHTVMGVEVNFISQVWADTLFMGVLFLAKWGDFTHNDVYIKEAARQVIEHYKCLRDEKTGLLFHGYHAKNQDNMSSVRWGRANAWGILSSCLILENIPEHWNEYKLIKDSVIRQIQDIAKYQNEDGSFCTVLNEIDTYKESTITCGFYYGVQKLNQEIELKDLVENHGKKAIEYIMKQIRQDGTVIGASGGTPVMINIEEYNKIPCVMSYYGQGLMIMALL